MSGFFKQLIMKEFLLNFKQYIRFITVIVTSREFAVIYVLLGTLGQIGHTYYLMESISSLSGTWRTVQAVVLSIFISSSLFYFTAIADASTSKEMKKIHQAVTMFTIIEILINIYYYSSHLLIEPENPSWFKFIIALLFAFLIPITIKLYSSHIRAKDWVIDIEQDRKAYVSEPTISEPKETEPEIKFQLNDEPFNPELINLEEFKDENDLYLQDLKDKDIVNEMLETVVENQIDDEAQFNAQVEETVVKYIDKFKNETKMELTEESRKLFETWINNEKDTIKSDIQKAFKQNADLFLNQFENKLKMLVQKYQNPNNQI